MAKKCKGLLFFIMIILTGCAGYRVRQQGNPLASDGIRTLAIPMFINKSSYPGVAPYFTKEVSSLFADYPKLKIYQSAGAKTDAILLGVIESPTTYAQAYNTTATKFTAGELEESIGERAQFYLPTASSYLISIRLLLIKNPTTEEKKLMLSELGKKIKNHPKVIFDQVFNYTGHFNRESKDTITSDSGGVVNYTKTRRYFDQTIETLAKQTARDLEDLVINVF